MNAYELADALENNYLKQEINEFDIHTTVQIANMLRQQAAQIEHLNQFGEQMALDAFERGKVFGYAECLKQSKTK